MRHIRGVERPTRYGGNDLQPSQTQNTGLITAVKDNGIRGIIFFLVKPRQDESSSQHMARDLKM
jgi:hypothetical protein